MRKRTSKRKSKRRSKKKSLKNNARKRKGNQKSQQGYLHISVLEDVSYKLLQHLDDAHVGPDEESYVENRFFFLFPPASIACSP